jgi:hypothetical protein
LGKKQRGVRNNTKTSRGWQNHVTFGSSFFGSTFGSSFLAYSMPQLVMETSFMFLGYGLCRLGSSLGRFATHP